MGESRDVLETGNEEFSKLLLCRDWINDDVDKECDGDPPCVSFKVGEKPSQIEFVA